VTCRQAAARHEEWRTRLGSSSSCQLGVVHAASAQPAAAYAGTHLLSLSPANAAQEELNAAAEDHAQADRDQDQARPGETEHRQDSEQQ
jgi:hypothetical protein